MEENKKPSNPDLHKGQVNLLQDRVTLRDHFAGLAMQGHIASEYGAGVHCNRENMQYLASAFYDMADAMLKQREL